MDERKESLVCWEYDSVRRRGNTVCGGDSGGPIIKNDLQIGIVSGGTQDHCTSTRWKKDDRSIPELGYGTRLTRRLLMWIQDQIWNDTSTCNVRNTIQFRHHENTIGIPIVEIDNNTCRWNIPGYFETHASGNFARRTELPNFAYRPIPILLK